MLKKVVINTVVVTGLCLLMLFGLSFLCLGKTPEQDDYLKRGDQFYNQGKLEEALNLYYQAYKTDKQKFRSLFLTDHSEENIQKCLTNARQVAASVDLYAIDNIGDYPEESTFYSKLFVETYLKEKVVCPVCKMPYKYSLAVEKDDYVISCSCPKEHDCLELSWSASKGAVIKRTNDQLKKAKHLTRLGIAYLVEENLPEAKKFLLQAIELQKDYVLAHYGLAKVCHWQKDYSQAVFYYQKVLVLNPWQNIVYYLMGTVEEERKDYPKAVEYYKMYLQKEVFGSRTEEAKKKVKELTTPAVIKYRIP